MGADCRLFRRNDCAGVFPSEAGKDKRGVFGCEPVNAVAVDRLFDGCHMGVGSVDVCGE